jgi:hypothetical protein
MGAAGDVYSLRVLLYELLTGTSSFEKLVCRLLSLLVPGRCGTRMTIDLARRIGRGEGPSAEPEARGQAVARPVQASLSHRSARSC